MIAIRLYTIAGLLWASFAVATIPVDEQPEIRFARGAINTTIQGAVVRSDRDIYPISAARGQTMTVEIGSLEDNAVFQIFPPGTNYFQDEHGIWTFRGQALRNADGGTRRWNGRLTSSGPHLIVVSGTRGNATYRLNVQIE